MIDNLASMKTETAWLLIFLGGPSLALLIHFWPTLFGKEQKAARRERKLEKRASQIAKQRLEDDLVETRAQEIICEALSDREKSGPDEEDGES